MGYSGGGNIPEMPIPQEGKRERCPKGHEMYVRSFLTEKPKQKHYEDLIPNRWCALCGRRWLQQEPP
jgi:hypothetical protein